MPRVSNTPRFPERDSSSASPGERRLARPPSDRFRESPPEAPETGTAEPEASRRAPVTRAILFGALAALVGAAAIVVLGGALAISAGLVVVAAALGYAVGLAVVVEGPGPAATRSWPARPWVAAVLAGLGGLLGQLGLWLFARFEGGVLPLVDYLGQTFGALVPLELLVAVAAAWWRAR